MNGSDNTSQPSNSFNGFVFLSSFFLNFCYESSWNRCIKHYNDIKSNDVSVSRISLVYIHVLGYCLYCNKLMIGEFVFFARKTMEKELKEE